MVPKPVRIRFVGPDGKISGHWFARAAREDGKDQKWKLSFKHPDAPKDWPRRVDGQGWENLIHTMIGQIYAIAENKYAEYHSALRQVNGAVLQLAAPRPGFRKGAVKRIRSQLNNEWHRYRQAIEKNMRGHLDFIANECEWGDPGIETLLRWPWDES